ncbi:MAG: hypothetical protein CSA04_02600 [Bacteroidetes bacterium]|nr:MAG: hypothetical protein CSA04_02600 [Bacteroidota bacterium]
MPLYSLYFSTKWAIEGFTESLAYELSPFNIRVKLIEPGATKTDFTSRGQVIANTSSVPAYAPYVEKIRQRTSSAATKNLSPSEVVAKTIYRAATDGSHKLRYPCAGKAKLILWIRRLLGYRLYTRIVRRVMG